MTLQNLMLVFLGGGAGACLRYLVAQSFGAQRSFPWATLCVNLIGCALGGWLAAKYAWSSAQPARAFFVVGVLGGFTTFSAFGVETIQLLQRGNSALAAVYVTLSVLGALAAVFLGFTVGR